jgi:hypothetical protein
LPQANSSHLHIFTQSAFTLIELFGSPMLLKIWAETPNAEGIIQRQ